MGQAFSSVNDDLLSQFRDRNAAVVSALKDYQKFLHNYTASCIERRFRLIGRPLDQLLKIGYDDLHRKPNPSDNALARSA